jgi:hypothetical protein
VLLTTDVKPFLKEKSKRWQHLLIYSERERGTSAGREIFVMFIVVKGIGFLCWRPGVYGISRL